VTRGQYYAK